MHAQPEKNFFHRNERITEEDFESTSMLRNDEPINISTLLDNEVPEDYRNEDGDQLASLSIDRV